MMGKWCECMTTSERSMASCSRSDAFSLKTVIPPIMPRLSRRSKSPGKSVPGRRPTISLPASFSRSSIFMAESFASILDAEQSENVYCGCFAFDIVLAELGELTAVGGQIVGGTIHDDIAGGVITDQFFQAKYKI